MDIPLQTLLGYVLYDVIYSQAHLQHCPDGDVHYTGKMPPAEEESEWIIIDCHLLME